MHPVPINQLFSLKDTLSCTVARFGKVLHQTYVYPGGIRNVQVVFQFEDKLIEASLANEGKTDKIAFCVLRGFADASWRSDDAKVLERLFDAFTERLDAIWPETFRRQLDIFHIPQSTPEGKTFIYVMFQKKESND